MQKLAEVFDAERPGLPRGRTSLPPEQVRLAQRERLLRAVMAAVAEKGYAAATVADVVARARVSRAAFYEQFADKEACFLAAAAAGSEVLVSRVTAGAAAERGSSPPDAVAALRGAIAAYLAICAEEPAFARCLLVELLAAGPRALALRNLGYGELARLFRAWHRTARARNPDWPEVPAQTHAAAVGAIHELVFVPVSAGRTGDLPALEEPLLALLLALFRVPADR
jgi:AcrR family transcriptional regulator